MTGLKALKNRIGSTRLGLLLLLGLVTLLIRFPTFGDPNYHIDESFYLLVGQRMHDGLVPYVDIWDRKPAGLFVLYWAITFLGDVYAYQLVAGIFAWLTAFTIALIVDRFANRLASVLSGVVYLCLIGALAGGGGQSPVFYNLFIALAALLVMGALTQSRRARLPWKDYAAMLLCGLALTIKPTAVVEGVLFGLVLLWAHWRESRSLGSLVLYGMRLVICGMLPTLAIWTAFIALGAFDEYWFATIQSIFLTDQLPDEGRWVRARWLLFIIWYPVLLAVAGQVILHTQAASGQRAYPMFISGWFVAAVLGFMLVPNYFDHYAIPLATALVIAAAPVFERRISGPILGAVACASLLLVSGYPVRQMERTEASINGLDEATGIIANHLSEGCLFVYDATTSLLRPFDDCLATKYVFPEHLSNRREAPAIGENPSKQISDVLEDGPTVIVKSVRPSIDTPNLETLEILEDYLAKDYSLVARVRLFDVVGAQDIEIWALD